MESPPGKRQRLDDPVDEPDGTGEAPQDDNADGYSMEQLLGLDPAVVDEFTSLQKDVDKLTEDCSSRILAIEYEYAQKKRAHLVARNKVLRRIPGFWAKVLAAHPHFRPYFTAADMAVLEYLLEVDYDDSEDPSRTGWKIRFVFDTNPYFDNTEVIKEYRYPDDSSPLVSTCTELAWKPGKAPLSDEQLGSEAPPPGTDYNFISLWLKGEPEGVYGGNDPLSEAFKDEIWPNPMAVLTAAAAAAGGSEEGGEEGEEEEEGEDGYGEGEGEDEGELEGELDDGGGGVIEIEDDEEEEDAELQEYEEGGEFDEGLQQAEEGEEDLQGGTGEGDDCGEGEEVEPGEGA